MLSVLPGSKPALNVSKLTNHSFSYSLLVHPGRQVHQPCYPSKWRGPNSLFIGLHSLSGRHAPFKSLIKAPKRERGKLQVLILVGAHRWRIHQYDRRFVPLVLLLVQLPSVVVQKTAEILEKRIHRVNDVRSRRTIKRLPMIENLLVHAKHEVVKVARHLNGFPVRIS